jgi:hypothetical protein
MPSSCVLASSGIGVGRKSGQIEINLLLFPSNHLTSEIVLVDLGEGMGESEWA